jgi:uncharacterized protein (DUF427 family)
MLRSYFSDTCFRADVWTYEKPYEAVDSIKEHLAFYPSRVDAIELIS